LSLPKEEEKEEEEEEKALLSKNIQNANIHTPEEKFEWWLVGCLVGREKTKRIKTILL